MSNNQILKNIDSLMQRIETENGVNQSLVSSIESLLGDNIITKERSIKSFTQHTSNINRDVVVSALESYRTTFLKESNVMNSSNTLNEEYSKFISYCIKDFLNKSKLESPMRLTKDQMKSLIIGYDMLFLDEFQDSRMKHVDTVPNVFVKDARYVRYIEQFLTYLDSNILIEAYAEAVYNIVSPNKHDFNLERAKDYTNRKFSKIKNIFKGENGRGRHSVDELYNAHTSLDSLNVKGHEEIASLLSVEKVSEALDVLSGDGIERLNYILGGLSDTDLGIEYMDNEIIKTIRLSETELRRLEALKEKGEGCDIYILSPYFLAFYYIVNIDEKEL